jgi:hypothetical protein
VSGHKIWICHTKRSLSNPYVKILIDPAAWDVEDPDSNDHGPEHHLREKNGIVWGDYALENPDDECTLDVPPPPPPPLECPDGSEADYVVTFPETSWYRTSRPKLSTLTFRPANTMTLISGDYNRGTNREGGPLVQPNERWRLLGSTPTCYTDDLVDTTTDISGVVTSGLSVVFDTGVSSVTAEHYSVGTGDRSSTNSVVPEYACLTAQVPDE